MAFRQPTETRISCCTHTHNGIAMWEKVYSLSGSIFIVRTCRRRRLRRCLRCRLMAAAASAPMHTRATKFFAQKLVLFKRILCERFSAVAQDVPSKGRRAREGERERTDPFENFSFISFRSEIDNNHFPWLASKAETHFGSVRFDSIRP